MLLDIESVNYDFSFVEILFASFNFTDNVKLRILWMCDLFQFFMWNMFVIRSSERALDEFLRQLFLGCRTLRFAEHTQSEEKNKNSSKPLCCLFLSLHKSHFSKMFMNWLFFKVFGYTLSRGCDINISGNCEVTQKIIFALCSHI